MAVPGARYVKDTIKYIIHHMSSNVIFQINNRNIITSINDSQFDYRSMSLAAGVIGSLHIEHS